MNNRFLIFIAGIVMLGSVNFAYAGTSEKKCVDLFYAEYDRCSRKTLREGEEPPPCRERYDDKVARCIQAAQEQQDRIDRGMNYDSNGRFVPKSIPSNSYVLPGTR